MKTLAACLTLCAACLSSTARADSLGTYGNVRVGTLGLGAPTVTQANGPTQGSLFEWTPQTTDLAFTVFLSDLPGSTHDYTVRIDSFATHAETPQFFIASSSIDYAFAIYDFGSSGGGTALAAASGIGTLNSASQFDGASLSFHWEGAQSDSAGGTPLQIQVRYAFVPGVFAAASPNPSCQSLDCMPLIHDDHRLHLSVQATAVPEPAPLLLLLAGLPLGIVLARRRAGRAGATARRSRGCVSSGLCAALLTTAVAGALWAPAAHAAGPEATPSAATATDPGTRREVGEIGAHGAAFAFGRSDVPISAAAGDTRLVFVTQPLTRSVAVLDRFTGRQVGQLPAPPSGWLLPFSLRVPRNGHVVVLDSGGFPSPTAPSIPRVYDYDFSYNHRTQQFSATLTRAVSFEGLPVVFAEDVEVTSSGAYVVSESIIGALWLIRPDGRVDFGLFPTTGVPIPQLAPCAFPGATVGGIPFETAGHFAPGVVGLAERQGQLYFSTTCNGGVYRVPMASLSDPARDPAARALDIHTVSPRAPGVAESLHGLAFNRHNPRDRWLYAADSLQLRVVRIDTADGSRQVVAADAVLFNFPSKLQFLPPVAGLSPLVVASDQEHRLAAINAAITMDVVQPPWIVTKLFALGGAGHGDLHGAASSIPAANLCCVATQSPP